MKALEMLKTNRDIKDRAVSYIRSIKRDIQKNVIDDLLIKKEKLEDEIYELEDMNLDTNLNKGLRRMTKEDVQTRFESIIQKSFELKMLSLEIASKLETFNKYFEGDTPTEELEVSDRIVVEP